MYTEGALVKQRGVLLYDGSTAATERYLKSEIRKGTSLLLHPYDVRQKLSVPVTP